METKFTKGRWVVDYRGTTGTVKALVNAKADITPTVATYRITPSIIKADGEVKANAHLIAAAPDMYALLQKFLPMDEDGNGSFIYDDGSECMGEDVVKLLAKARGE